MEIVTAVLHFSSFFLSLVTNSCKHMKMFVSTRFAYFSKNIRLFKASIVLATNELSTPVKWIQNIIH